MHDGAVGHGQFQVVTVGAAAVLARARAAVAGLLVRTVVEVEQGVHLGIDDQHHVAAAATVAAVGAAERLELLPVDRGAAVATIARGDVQDHPVHETHHCPAAFSRTSCWSRQEAV